MSAGTMDVHPSPLAPMLNESQLGSAAGQALTGIAGIVLAIILVVGQISLATTKGIAVHTRSTAANLAAGNAVIESVAERSAPTPRMTEVLAGQARTLAHTQQAMVATNKQLQAISGTTARLDKVVGRMSTSSTGLASGVAAMDRQTTRIATILGKLPGATSRTHRQLARIDADTSAINGELGAISPKLQAYGLPKAKRAPTGAERR